MQNKSITLTDALAASEELLTEAVNTCVLQLNALPRNPKTENVSESPRAFTISSKDLFSSGNWSAFYHDWGAQYDFVKGLLAARRFADLRKLLDGEAVRHPHQGDVKLAPEVIKNVKKVTGDLLPVQKATGK